jgi:hypothetical protein
LGYAAKDKGCSMNGSGKPLKNCWRLFEKT